jgi:octanoyl-[GcvH]:protein N-octanoyltransferase
VSCRPETWTILDDGVLDAPTAIARDDAIGTEVAASLRGTTARLWGSSRALIVTQLERRFTAFQAAVERMEAQGWPVHIRPTGGGAFAIDSGTLNLSLITPRKSHFPEPCIEAAYGEICEIIAVALAHLGLRVSIGPAPRAFCDGRFNILFDGKKLAGTAQRWRGSHDGGYILVHAGIYVTTEPTIANDAVSEFYEAAQQAKSFDLDALTNVAEALGTTRSALDLMNAARDSLVSVLQNGGRSWHHDWHPTSHERIHSPHP